MEVHEMEVYQDVKFIVARSIHTEAGAAPGGAHGGMGSCCSRSPVFVQLVAQGADAGKETEVEEMTQTTETQTQEPGTVEARTESFHMVTVFILSMIVGLLVFSSLSRRWFA